MQLAEAKGIAAPFGCRLGACGTCSAKILSGEVMLALALLGIQQYVECSLDIGVILLIGLLLPKQVAFIPLHSYHSTVA